MNARGSTLIPCLATMLLALFPICTPPCAASDLLSLYIAAEKANPTLSAARPGRNLPGPSGLWPDPVFCPPSWGRQE
ncbi:MAG TPA: hypothetical protein EYP57_10490 [Thermodesulfobacteriaceae bacterium]|nr:hypothetical protein [Thermodesulfobacteriaceae bacterium]